MEWKNDDSSNRSAGFAMKSNCSSSKALWGMLGGALGGLIWIIPAIHRSNWPKSSLLFGYGIVIFATSIMLASVLLRRWIPLWGMPLLSLGVSILAAWATLLFSYCQGLSLDGSLGAIQVMKIAAYPTLLASVVCMVSSFVLRHYGEASEEIGRQID